jgi:hypothetical protein
MQYKLVDTHHSRTLVVVLDGELTTIPSAHANYDRIVRYLDAGGDDTEVVRSLLDVRGYLTRGFTALSERVAFDGHQITFDGDPIDTTLSRHLLRLLREGGNVRPVVHFLEKLAANPSRKSKKHLWTWLQDRDFTLTEDGDFIAYKAVQDTPDNLSITAGRNTVRVNDTIHTGHIPNPIGAIVSIPRSTVDPNRDNGCSTGLHVGTWAYAEHFAAGTGKVLTVKVNPRDVVAVPRDYEYAKMRVCRYLVLATAPVQHDTALLSTPDDEHDKYEQVAYVA